jgi:hypothetical protein
VANYPKLTKRASRQIARLEAGYREHLPPGNYLSFIGSDVDVNPDRSPEPTFRLFYSFSDGAGVREEFLVESHGVKLAYALHDRLLAGLKSSVLDFDGDTFLFVDASTADSGSV